MEQLKKLLAALTLRQRIIIAATAAAIGISLWTLTNWNRERNFKPLYTSLSSEDAGAIVERLKAENVEFRLEEPGTVKVPAERVAELRLNMASAGVPKTGRIGFELFDQTNFGLTEFAEQVNYRRAIEGELERSIGSLAEVERARVHISLPKDSVFLESRQEAKASVVVKLRPGKTLSTQNGASICHLVSSAVDRLAPEAVTVLDSNGTLLVRPKKQREDDGAEPPEVNLDYRKSLERDLTGKVEATLEPLLGTGNFHAGVSVDCDFAAGEQSEETYDPAKSVMLTSQKTEDVSTNGLTGGTPGTSSTLPRPAVRAASSGTNTTRRSENITYQSSRFVRHLKIPQGVVRRISVAVLVNQKVRWTGTGKTAKRFFEPPPQETMDRIRTLVSAAAGLSDDRGDKLTVESLPFESLMLLEPPPPPAPPVFHQTGWWPPAFLPALLKIAPLPVWIGMAAGVVLILAAAIFLLLRRRRKLQKATLEEKAKLDAAKAAGTGLDSAQAMQNELIAHQHESARLAEEALKSLALPPPETKKSQVLTKHIREVTHKDPAGMAQLIRTWVNETER
jgi:flagellar M-ring protein FliF